MFTVLKLNNPVTLGTYRTTSVGFNPVDCQTLRPRELRRFKSRFEPSGTSRTPVMRSVVPELCEVCEFCPDPLTLPSVCVELSRIVAVPCVPPPYTRKPSA